MKQVFIEEKKFDKIDFTQTPLSKEYEYCNLSITLNLKRYRSITSSD